MLIESELIFAAEKAFTAADTSIPGTHRIGFVNLELICLNINTINPGFISAATFTSTQIRNGLTGSQWFALDTKLRTLYRQLLKCKQA